MTTVLTVTSSAIVSSSLVYRNAIFLHLKTNQTKNTTQLLRNLSVCGK